MSSPVPGTSKTSSPVSPRPGIGTSRARLTRARKRKRISSEGSSDTEHVLPENLLEVEKSIHASAVKNNLDEVSVKKLLKKVVTNDHVLALVKLREEQEENAIQTDGPQPKLTRAKVKELKKVSPKTAWDLESLKLTPIKHIPVKTRPEVTALIAQSELPDDEDDDEYEPTHDDVPSDDDHTLESCSDVDSQPRTPATPCAASPRVVKDGPFKVPQDLTPRRKLDMDEDATIARRTRSKLSLSATPIEHIESSFVPPDEPPLPYTDDVWTDFLQFCLNPETEDADDDDDPEYDVAKDPDAHDEDEEGLENIIKISKKELNDLVTELFNVMPENLGDDVLSGKLASDALSGKLASDGLSGKLASDGLSGKLASDGLSEKNASDLLSQKLEREAPALNKEGVQLSSWEGKQEPHPEDETPPTPAVQKRQKRLSIGKSEPISDSECQGESESIEVAGPTAENKKNKRKEVEKPINKDQSTAPTEVTMTVLEGSMAAYPPVESPAPPALVQSMLVPKQTVTVQLQPSAKVLPEQIEILQQQLRQHIQIATANFLQLYVHPVHWSFAPHFKEYVETLHKLALDNPKSVANVCNLKPAMDLVNSWEKSVSEDTDENKKMVEFVQGEVERARRRAANNSLYVGDFHQMFLKVISNSPVFLYPYLLPSVPYRCDGVKKFGYLRCEDELIAIGIEQFWSYVENNPDLYKLRTNKSNIRMGLISTVQLVCKHMFPWIPPRAMMGHIKIAKNHAKNNEDNPIKRFFTTGEIKPVKHELLPFNPKLTLYEQPINEMPRCWIKYLAKSSQRFHDHLFRRTTHLNRVGAQPVGIPVELGTAVQPPTKRALPISFTQDTQPKQTDNFDDDIKPPTTQNVMYSVIQTAEGAFLIPVTLVTNTENATTPGAVNGTSRNLPEESTGSTVSVTVPIKNYVQVTDPIVTAENSEHCACCIILRRISKQQSLITDFFKTLGKKSCPCKQKRKVKYPTVTRKLRLLLSNYKSTASMAWLGLSNQIKALMNEMKYGTKKSMVPMRYTLDEIVAVTQFQLKLTIRSNIARNIYTKRRIHGIMAKFNPDSDDIYPFTAQVEKILGTEGVDVYNEFIGFLTMDQAEKIGRYTEYFRQECLIAFMKKVEELVPCKQHKHKILKCAQETLANLTLGSCQICTRLLQACRRYPALADYVFSLFPHTRHPQCIEKEKIPLPNPKPIPKNKSKSKKAIDVEKVSTVSKDTNSIGVNDSDTQAKNHVGNCSIDTAPTNEELSQTAEARGNIEEHNKNGEMDNTEERSQNSQVMYDTNHVRGIDNVQNPSNDDRSMHTETNNAKTTDNVENNEQLNGDNPEDETMCDDSQIMDYEADHSDSDDDGNENLTIIEDPDELRQTRGNYFKHGQHIPENVINTPDLTVTKTEIQDPSESDMSMMIMSEDETSIVKTEPTEWKRDEDKRLLEVLKQTLTPEEMKDKTILEIIEQKKVLELAADSLPEKSLDDVRARILYLLEFLVTSEQTNNQ